VSPGVQFKVDLEVRVSPGQDFKVDLHAHVSPGQDFKSRPGGSREPRIDFVIPS
jgi:hypothetical protein